MSGIGVSEIMMIFLVGILVFDYKRLPEFLRDIQELRARFLYLKNEVSRMAHDIQHELNGVINKEENSEEVNASENILEADKIEPVDVIAFDDSGSHNGLGTSSAERITYVRGVDGRLYRSYTPD